MIYSDHIPRIFPLLTSPDNFFRQILTSETPPIDESLSYMFKSPRIMLKARTLADLELIDDYGSSSLYSTEGQIITQNAIENSEISFCRIKHFDTTYLSSNIRKKLILKHNSQI